MVGDVLRAPVVRDRFAGGGNPFGVLAHEFYDLGRRSQFPTDRCDLRVRQDRDASYVIGGFPRQPEAVVLRALNVRNPVSGGLT